MRSQLAKAIDLAAYTGDKIIVVDEKTDKGLVVMNLDEYEKLVIGENKGRKEVESLTEEELLDKINRDIVSWKSANEEVEEKDERGVLEEDLVADAAVEEEPEDENLYYYEEKGKEEKEIGNAFTSIKEELKNRRHWEIPSSVKKGAEEVN